MQHLRNHHSLYSELSVWSVPLDNSGIDRIEIRKTGYHDPKKYSYKSKDIRLDVSENIIKDLSEYAGENEVDLKYVTLDLYIRIEFNDFFEHTSFVFKDKGLEIKESHRVMKHKRDSDVQSI